MLEFYNNTAHTFGRYGLWIFPFYHPMKGSGCGHTIASPAKFEALTSWNNMRGAEVVAGGAIRFVNNVVLDNDLAGIEVVTANARNAPWGGAMVKDSLIIGQSELKQYNTKRIGSQRDCTVAGIKLPGSPKLIVSNVTFFNFSSGSWCHAISPCAHCLGGAKCGAWPTRFEKLTFVNSPRRAIFEWLHQAYLEDLDGTLTGVAGSTALPQSGILDPELCVKSDKFSDGVPGVVCQPSIKFTRISWNNPKPSSVLGKDGFVSNKHGIAYTPFRKKGFTHPLGWTMIVPCQHYNLMGWKNATQFTNISYNLGAYEMQPDYWFYLVHQLRQVPDYFTTTGEKINGSVGIPDPSTEEHGVWNFNVVNKKLTILMEGSNATSVNLISAPPLPRFINLKVYRCYFLQCIPPTPPPPPEGRPASGIRYWSKMSAWKDAPDGYGGANGQLPKDGDNVMILPDTWVVADIAPPDRLPNLNRLFIYGTLELQTGHNHHLGAKLIFIGGKGNLIVGWKNETMQNNVIISLIGNWDTKDLPLNNGPNVGSKAIGVFGRIQMFGQKRAVYWTRLSKTANAGDTSIDLVQSVDWKQTDEILISTSSYQATEAEKFIVYDVENNGKRLILDKALRYKHLGVNHTIGGRSVLMQAKVALLTRNIRIEGIDDPAGSLGQQSFGCRVIVGRYQDGGVTYIGKGQFESVQFKNCGQEGWNEPYDPR